MTMLGYVDKSLKHYIITQLRSTYSLLFSFYYLFVCGKVMFIFTLASGLYNYVGIYLYNHVLATL